MSDKKLTDSEIVKGLEICSNNGDCKECPINPHHDNYGYCTSLAIKAALDLINRLQAENKSQSRMIKMLNGSIEDYKNSYINQKSENERLKATVDSFNDIGKLYSEIKAEAYREFAEKVDEILKRYAHLHKNADKARHSTEEYADGTPMEMVSVWEVLSLKKWEMCDYETMNTLEDNIEIIAKERLLTELEKDLRLLKKELVGEDNESKV